MSTLTPPVGVASFFNTIGSSILERSFVLVLVLSRVCEPELMQDLSQVNAYANADFNESDQALILKLEEILSNSGKNLNADSLIIDLGCGPGNISHLLSLRWPSSFVIGLDGSAAMISVARSRMRESGLKRLSYLCIQISELNPMDHPMVFNRAPDVIISNSLLHHLHDPSQLWKTIKRLSSPGTISLHRDLRRPDSIEMAIDFQAKYLPIAPAVLKKDYIASLNASFTAQEIVLQLQSEGLDTFQVFEVDERYVEVVGTL